MEKRITIAIFIELENVLLKFNIIPAGEDFLPTAEAIFSYAERVFANNGDI